MPIYFTHAVDFEYSILRGDIRYWVTSEDLDLAWKSNLDNLKKQAYDCNADCIIDARINIISKALADVEEGEFSSRIFALEGRTFYKLKNNKE